MKTIRIILFLILVGSPISLAMAHGGEDHGEAPAPVNSSDNGMAVHETSSDQIELVLKHSKIKSGKKADLTLFISDASTNKPVSDITIDFEISDLKEPKIKFEPLAGKPGQFTAHAEFPKDGSYDAVISVSGSVSDLLTLNKITVGDPQKQNENARLPWWQILLGATGIVLLIFLFKKFGPKKSCCQIFIFCFISGMVFHPSNILAHGDEDHGDGGSLSNSSQSLGNQILMPKESQFLLGLETAVAAKDNVVSMVETQGRIVPKPSGNQNLLAINSGRLQAVAGKIPTVGQSVKKGDVLGMLESIGTLSFKAPFDGVIAFADFHPGQWVESGTQIFTIVDPTVLWIEAPLFEKDFSKIKEGSTATLVFDGTNENKTGDVLSVGQSIDEQSRSSLVTIEIQNSDNTIKVGQWAKVYLETKENTQVIVIPKSSLLMKDGVPMVFIKERAEVFEGRAVTIVGEYKDQVFVSGGVAEGEKVVTNGSYQLFPLLKTLSVGK